MKSVPGLVNNATPGAARFCRVIENFLVGRDELQMQPQTVAASMSTKLRSIGRSKVPRQTMAFVSGCSLPVIGGRRHE